MSRPLALLSALLLLAGCRDAVGPASPPQSLETDAEMPRALVTVPSIEAAGIHGPGGTSFSVERRTPHLKHAPCSSCHGSPGPARPSGGRRRAHEAIIPTHPAALASDCATCHDPRDFERFRLQDGGTVSLDEAFHLCRQCHFQQAEDWAAGAHGKRLSSWRGERVDMSCTACHDAHAPATIKRMPVEFPKLSRSTPLAKLPAGQRPSSDHPPASGH